MRKFSRNTASVVIAGALLILSATSAQAVDYISEAANGLGQSNIHVDSSVSFSKASEIGIAFKGESVGVVAVPESAISTINANLLATEISNRSDANYDLVIVAVDKNKDSYGVFSVEDNASEISKILNENNTGDAGETILGNSQQIISIASSSKAVAPENETQQSDSFSAVILITSILVVGVGGFLIMKFRSKKSPKVSGKDKIDEIFSEISESFESEYRKLLELHESHLQVYVANGIGKNLTVVLYNTLELFKRLKKSSTPQTIALSAAHYTDVYKKLNSALSENYFLDIIDHPDFWDNPDERKLEVANAVKAISSELITNIKQVNSSRDIEFKVALDSLVSAIENNNNHKEIYNGRKDQ